MPYQTFSPPDVAPPPPQTWSNIKVHSNGNFHVAGIVGGGDSMYEQARNTFSSIQKLIETAGGIPVLVRGGSKAPEAEILARTAALIAQGAAGIVYGRNIIQHPKPAAITRALMAVVHDGATPADALKFLA